MARHLIAIADTRIKLMTAKVILVVLNDRHHVADLMDRALGFADSSGSDLIALHTRPDPAAMLAQVDGQYFATMATSVFDTIDRESREGATIINGLLTDWAKTHDIGFDTPPVAGASRVVWREITGPVDYVVSNEGQLADLIIIGRPPKTETTLDETALEAALFGTGRPVIIMPLGKDRVPTGKAMVAWNGSLESSRALAASLPFLKKMQSVTVITISPDELGRPIAAQVAAYLGRLGIPAVPLDIMNQNKPAGVMILEAAAAGQAELIVMGAYTHSRVRELFLGGATREALRSTDVPVLMAH
jgi:nucleotide-binding universal stress UspA family protein